MRHLLLGGAAAVAMLAAPALAQQPPSDAQSGTAPATEWVAQSNSGQVIEAPAQAEGSATSPVSGQLTVQGVTPAEALGAVDPTKLSAGAIVQNDTGKTAQTEAVSSVTSTSETSVQFADAGQAPQGDGTAKSDSTLQPDAAGESTTTTLAATAPEEMPAEPASMVQVADVAVPLPAEVAEVVQDGGYSTDDLIAAQLAAIMSAGQQTAEVAPQPGKQPDIPPG